MAKLLSHYRENLAGYSRQGNSALFKSLALLSPILRPDSRARIGTLVISAKQALAIPFGHRYAASPGFA
jgi:hypothetical protein